MRSKGVSVYPFICFYIYQCHKPPRGSLDHRQWQSVFTVLIRLVACKVLLKWHEMMANKINLEEREYLKEVRSLGQESERQIAAFLHILKN